MRPPRTEPWRRPGAPAPPPSSPIGELAEGDKKVTVSNNQIGPVTQELYDELTGIQWGRLPDTHGWTMKVC